MHGQDEKVGWCHYTLYLITGFGACGHSENQTFFCPPPPPPPPPIGTQCMWTLCMHGQQEKVAHYTFAQWASAN